MLLVTTELLNDIADDFAIIYDWRPEYKLVGIEIHLATDGITVAQFQDAMFWVLGYLKAIDRGFLK